MIPAQFDYVRPTSVEDAVGALTEAGDDAKVITGGQSLLPLLRIRLAAPNVLVDCGRIEEMRGVSDAGDALLIGAATTHNDVMHDPLVRGACRAAGDHHGHRGRPGDPAPRHLRRVAGACRPGR